MKKIQYFIAAMLLAFPMYSFAQVDLNDDDDEEDT